MGMTMPEQAQKLEPLVLTYGIGRSSFEIAKLPKANQDVTSRREKQRPDRVLPPV
jgi:hypothetical protein